MAQGHPRTCQTRFERLPMLRSQPALAYFFAIALSVGALALRWALEGYLPPGYPFLTFFPPVILTSFLFGRGPGVCAAVIGGVFAWYFFIRPAGSFDLTQGTLLAMGFYTMVVAVDIALVHWMQQANARLHAEREEKRRLAEEGARLVERSDLLFQELQHRVGNNLQMVAAVLSLQLRGMDEPAARSAITDAVARVQVIGSIQRQLYRGNGELVPLDQFVSDVCGQVVRSNGRPGITCEVQAQSGLVLPPEAAVPMALILAEAIANALEHGFMGREAGRIHVALEQADDSVMLSVIDNGVGIPPATDPTRTESLGLRISRILSRQLGAAYALENSGHGCTMRLTLPSGRFTAVAERRDNSGLAL